MNKINLIKNKLKKSIKFLLILFMFAFCIDNSKINKYYKYQVECYEKNTGKLLLFKIEITDVDHNVYVYVDNSIFIFNGRLFSVHSNQNCILLKTDYSLNEDDYNKIIK
jgi:hypothetical protein